MSATLQQLFGKCDFEGGPLAKAQVQGIEANRKENTLEVSLLAPRLLEESSLQAGETCIRRAYGLKKAHLQVRYQLHELDQAAADYCRRRLRARYPSMAAAGDCLRFQEEKGALVIDAPQQWLPRAQELREPLQLFLQRELGLSSPVEVREGKSFPAHCQDFEKQQKALLQKALLEQSRCAPAAQKPPAPKKPAPEKRYMERKKPEGVIFRPKNSDAKVLYGKPAQRPIIHMDEVNVDSGKVAVEGEVFFAEAKTLTSRGKTIYTFDITDGHGSVRCVKVLPDEECALLMDAVKVGSYVMVQGVANYSTFEREVVISPQAVVEARKKLRQDKAENKRVELHLHTCMSSMDGLTDTAQAIQTAARWGHKAIAITDHGVAQSFPDAMHAQEKLRGKGQDIKVIYGVEAYFVNDLAKSQAVQGQCDTPLRGETVVFDLETTGLSPRNCEIIEIAAIVVKDGEEKETFHTYVSPTSPVPYEITKLTGIRDEMVDGAPSQEEALRAFLDFAGDRPLCAHNAGFDVSFLRAGCEKFGIEREFCSIDTVEMCRVLLPHLKRHKLNIVAEDLGLSFNHHRALDDTGVLAKIYDHLLSLIEEKAPVERVDQINHALDVCRGGEADPLSRRSHHMIILVKNLVGLKNLYQLISFSHLKYFKRHPIIPATLLMQYREGLILGSACEAGELFSAIVQGKTWNELKEIASFYDFLEIQPIDNNRFMLENGTAKDEEQLRDFNRTVLKLGDALHKPVAATGDVHFLEPEDSQYRAILMAGMGFSDADKQAPLYFKTTDEMLKEFAYLGQKRAYEVVVENPNKIAELCEDLKPVPDDKCPPVIPGSADEISQMANRKAVELYGDPLPQLVKDRLDAELIPIINNGFDVMYLIAQKLVAKSLEDGYLVGSRGSVGSSFVAFLTGITEVNSLPAHYRCPHCKHSIFPGDPNYGCGVDLPDKLCPQCGTPLIKDGFNIPFATFLGFNGEKAPDIDLNFSSEYQSRAHRELIRMFGEDHVFRAGTIGTVKSKTAYGFVKKYNEERGLMPGKAEENRLVVGCTGIKRTTGQHPGGLIIVPNDRSIYEFCPVQRPADDPQSDIITTHFDYHSIDQNLLKFDMLGHEDPTMIKALEDLTRVNAREIPLDDPDTMSIFTSLDALKIDDDGSFGKTGAVAIPEFGTRFVRGMLEITQPHTFDELLRISGLSHGTNVWLNNAKDYIESGDATLKDVISVRDDIMTYLIQTGIEPQQSFKISESVRKGKGLKPEWEELMREHGIADWYIESCKKIQYMFPRAHAAAYVMMAYRIAWFKVHQPMAFYSAYFGIRASGFDASIMCRGDGLVMEKTRELQGKDKRTAAEEDTLTTLEVVHEFYRRGFTFQKLDIYESDVNKFLIRGNTLVPPLTSLPGLGEAAARDIVEERKNGKFMSTEEMILRCGKVTKGVIETLTAAGALEGIPKSNQIDLFEML